MRTHLRVMLLLVALAFALTACATSEQWSEWRQHSSHFASGDHLWFSLRHQGENPTPHVRRQDVDRARTQAWWGEPIVVRPEQIFAG